MFRFVIAVCVFSAFLLQLTMIGAAGQGIDGYSYRGEFDPLREAVTTKGQFNGYTNYWHDIFWKWNQYGNLFQVAEPNVKMTIAQARIDIADELGIPGLWMQEGFLYELMKTGCRTLENPSLSAIEEAASRGNVLVFANSASAAGQALCAKLPGENSLREKLNSHQFNAVDFHEMNAFYLERGERKIFVVASVCGDCLNRMKEYIALTAAVLQNYDLHRGWFGTGTLLYSVTIQQFHPLEVIAKGMNQGNSWFTFSGYMDFLMQNELPEWMAKVNLPIVTDVGLQRPAIYGCENWNDVRLQDTPTAEAWIKFARDRNGYIFKPVYSGEGLRGFRSMDLDDFDGYVAQEGNKKQIDNEDIPFILTTGYIGEEAPPCMVLFTEKNAPLTKERMWEAILSRREVGVLPGGKMLGPAQYRNALQMLLLDRVFLEEYYGDRLNLEAEIQDRTLRVTVSNTYPVAVSGTLDITPAPELVVKGQSKVSVTLPARSSRTMTFTIQPTLAAMDRANPVAVRFTWGEHAKGTLALMDLPRAISVHQLLYGHAPRVEYPVTVHNFSDRTEFPVRVQVFSKNNPSSVAYSAEQTVSTEPAKAVTAVFPLGLSAGRYNVKVSALGAENVSQLGVGENTGAPRLYEIDANGDGINEYRMENDKVRVTLLRTGARVIEYIVKERNDNIFFKLWPEREATDKRPFRERGFYPYGGFEDFLGQGSMETHWVYDAEILKADGDFVRVKMTADYYGNKLEKIFTLYGDSPLLEVRFALAFINPEANMLGPQPILELGARHWTEDIFTLPAREGLVEFRMKPETAYGRVIDMKEGWNAGYDPKEDITFIGAFPVTEPEFMHMFMNHPRNQESTHYYVEFQPWVRIYQKSTMYFSYFIWGDAGPWEKGLEAIRARNLVSVR